MQWLLRFAINVIPLSPTFKAIFDRRGEREREREREREKRKMFFPITSRAALQHREKKYCMRKKNFFKFHCVCVCVFVCVCVCMCVCVCVCVCVCL